MKPLLSLSAAGAHSHAHEQIEPATAGSPNVASVEAIALSSLVDHQHAVDAGDTLEVVQRVFQSHRVEYMAVIRAGKVVGMCARGQIGFIMAARFGFAIYSQNPIDSLLVEQPLIISTETPLRILLDEAMSRRGEAFQQDVVLVDPLLRLVGLIKVQTLAHVQSQIVAAQVAELRRQHDALRQQNLELFRATHAARQSQGVLHGLFESHALGVALLNTRGEIIEHNRRLMELLANCGEAATPDSLVAWLKPADHERFLTLLDSHARGIAAAGTHEFAIEVPERGERTFRCSTGWIRETGQVCACLDDVTEQRALERRALQHEKQILLDTLVGGVAHELNNKLTPVLGFSELLAAESDGRSGDFARHIIQSVGEAARIIRQLLELSTPARQISQLLDLRSIVEETLVMMKFTLREAGCAVRTSLPAAPVCVAGDSAQLKQVAMNLVINAVHAVQDRPDPTVTLEVRLAGERTELIISDNGCGIAPENVHRIFDPFFTTKGPERGTGLGLSICSSIIRSHRGEIRVRSRPEEGAEFTVSLPAQAGSPRLTMTENGTVWTAPNAVFGRGERVLVVEDELVVRRLMQEVLNTQFGCRVDLACDGAEALALAEQQAYALVLADVKMPRMSGVEFYHQLRERQLGLADRVVFVTGQPGDRELRTDLEISKVPMVTKPFTLEQLTEACRPFFLGLNAAPAGS